LAPNVDPHVHSSKSAGSSLLLLVCCEHTR
jgi:hypothetical protein